MKIDRLISIILLLLERKKISVTKLAEMFEVSPRTIYRDLETIDMAGIPIITYPGVNGGIGIIEEYKIDKKLFTISDITTILMGLGSISTTLSDEKVTNTLAKVKGLVPEDKIGDIESKSNQIAIDFSSWSGNKSLQRKLEEIKRAMNDNKFISFTYIDFNNERSQRKVEPYQLVFKETYWYLQGYCSSRQDFRTFKLARISTLQIHEESFIPREFQNKSLGTTEQFEKETITIKLLVDESLRERMLEICEEENIEFYGSNKLIVNLPFLENEYGYSFLLSLGDKCECLEPENVRREIIGKIKGLSDIYSGGL